LILLAVVAELIRWMWRAVADSLEAALGVVEVWKVAVAWEKAVRPSLGCSLPA
jgi:hypothetical protein